MEGGGGFVVKLVTAEVIHPHTIFFTLSFLFLHMIFEIKKIIILVHENYD